MSKPLTNSMVLPSQATWASATSVVDWSTPRKASELSGHLKLFTELSPDHNTRRLLFRKVKKALSEQAFHLATSRHQVRVLEAKVERIRPRKKKSIPTDPNTKFANIWNIQRAQEDSGDRLVSPSRLAGVELPRENNDCIIVAVEGS
ncbi:transposase [Colletotrichum salicis]|uniref:Transposase n=1 Tax=Colletotrichum salicis TaxID=1209931 RepID=A0A135SUA7_9PEZI|nr:transposase [Colletotrichum salicis]